MTVQVRACKKGTYRTHAAAHKMHRGCNVHNGQQACMLHAYMQDILSLHSSMVLGLIPVLWTST